MGGNSLKQLLETVFVQKFLVTMLFGAKVVILMGNQFGLCAFRINKI